MDGALLAVVMPDNLMGTTVADRYQILELVGAGGWSKVFKAKQLGLNRLVAVKVMHAHLVNSQENMARFQREAEAASKLAHPAIAGVFDFGVLKDGRPYMVMEYLEGRTIENVMDAEGAIPWQRAVPMLVQSCEGLAYAHSCGVLHRDLKPSNVLIVQKPSGEEQVKILDFGLAKLFVEDGASPKSLTTTGTTLGTPVYMSPEQCRGLTVDKRSDIYSLGCLMYEVLTNNRAIDGDSMYEIMHAHLEKAPAQFADFKDVQVPQSIECVVHKALSKDPGGRYADMSELKDGLLDAVKNADSKFEPAKQIACPLGRRVAATVPPTLQTFTLIGVKALIVITVCTAGYLGWMSLQHRENKSPAPHTVAPPTQATIQPAPVNSAYKNLPAELAALMNDSDPVRTRIAHCENWLNTHHEFNYMVENELRHMYGAVDDNKMMYWTNSLLKHRPMDDYQVQILSAWQIGKDNNQALRSLLFNAEKFKDYKFVRNACLLKVGDLYASEGNNQKARKYYRQVVTTTDPDLADYRSLAKIQRQLLSN